MHLRTLSLQNFRNYQSQELSFHPRFNLIIGKNAQGKTNLLEAVYFLSFLNSFRTSTRADLIKGADHPAFLVGSLHRDEVDHEIRIAIENNKKVVKLNGKHPNLFKDYYGLVPVLLFEPKDVYLFRESPSSRRKFINKALFLEDPFILKPIRDYEKIVAHKNKLLKEGYASDEQLFVWNESLATLGGQIISKRLQWIQKVNERIASVYSKLSLADEPMRLTYEASVGEILEDSEAFVVNQLREELQKRAGEERRRRESIVGPHRDDWTAWLGDRMLGNMGSQGENRSGVIALKAMQVDLFENTHNFPPLFLLDDVASELDPKRTEALLHYLRNMGGQVFLTTTEPTEITPHFRDFGTSFMVEDGQAHVLG